MATSLYERSGRLRRLAQRGKKVVTGGVELAKKGFAAGKQIEQRISTEGIVGGTTLGEKAKSLYHGKLGKGARFLAGLIPGVKAPLEAGGKALFGEGPKARQFTTFKDVSGEERQISRERGRSRAEPLVSKAGQFLAATAAQKLATSFPEQASRFLKRAPGQVATGAAIGLGGGAAVALHRKLVDWQTKEKRQRAAQREFRGTAEGKAVLRRVQKQYTQAQYSRETDPKRLAQARQQRELGKRSLQAFQQKYKPMEGRTLSRRADQFVSGRGSMVDPQQAARRKSFTPDTSRAAMQRRGTTTYGQSGSSYATKSGRGTLNIFKTPARRSPTARGSYPSREAYQRRSTPVSSRGSYPTEEDMMRATTPYSASYARDRTRAGAWSGGGSVAHVKAENLAEFMRRNPRATIRGRSSSSTQATSPNRQAYGATTRSSTPYARRGATPTRATYANPYAGTKYGIGYKPSYARGRSTPSRSSSSFQSSPRRSASSTPSRSYASFRSQVKVTGPGYTAPRRSASSTASRSFTPFARR